MLKRYAIWDKQSDIITPIGEVLTAEQWVARYPVAGVPSVTIVCSAGAATTVANYALFGGGFALYNRSSVDAYNTSLTRSTLTSLSVARCELAATTLDDYALFGGGKNTSKVVDAYDSSLTCSTPDTLYSARYALAAATIGDYALFGGGATGSGTSSNSRIVDVYQVS